MFFSGSNCAVIEEEIQTTKKCLGVSISFKLCGPNKDVPRFYVASINDDSPALLSSIKPGDQILKINSQVIFGSDVDDVVKYVTDLQNVVSIICSRYKSFDIITKSKIRLK